MIKCPNPECGYENVDGTQFCEGCGEELPHGAAATTSGATHSATSGASSASASSGNMIKCPACDNLNPPENVVCEVCGTELKPAHSPDAATVGASGHDTLTQTAPPLAQPNAVGVPDANAFTTGTANAPQTATHDAVSGAPVGTGTATPPASVLNSALSSDPTLLTAPPAPSPAITIAGVSDSSPAGALPVVAAGATTSGVTTPDTLGQQAAPVSSAPASTSGGELAPGKVKLVVEQGMTIGKQFVLGDSEILVGREDDDEQIYPDVDLSDQDEGYVHRRHAQLHFQNGALTVTHLGGANKTRVNNKPLPDNEAQPVKIGDKISFGKVVTRLAAL